ncbi:hypothetical protein BT69DRAFT_1321640 [Atractiella rhizophila]|nr:hypothetical protein BT69DRAFT_1321640 [Atractiella rhizophila]
MYLEGYLHRDISNTNIGLEDYADGVKGILRDFNFAVTLDPKLRTVSHSRTGTYLFLAASLFDLRPPSHQLIHDVESFYHILTIETFSRLTYDPAVQLLAQRLVLSYRQAYAGSAKVQEILGAFEGFAEEDLEQIDILGPLILVFRQFLGALYIPKKMRNGFAKEQIDILGPLILVFRQFLGALYIPKKMRNGFAKDRRNNLSEYFSRLNILSPETDQSANDSVIDVVDFDQKDDQKCLLQFLIKVLGLVIKRNKKTLKKMVHNARVQTDEILVTTKD